MMTPVQDRPTCLTCKFWIPDRVKSAGSPPPMYCVQQSARVDKKMGCRMHATSAKPPADRPSLK